MKKRNVIIAAGLGLAQLALFQQAAAQDTIGIDEVVISSTKLNQKQSQTGKVISVISREVLERSQGKTVPQLLGEQSGIYITGAQGNLGKDKALYLRGALNAFTPILIDGMQVNDPSSVGAIFDLRLLSIDQIERIEILRGGQSTLYGSDAVAGVINIITKKGSQGPFSTSVTARAGSFGTYEGNLAVSGGVEKLSYNLNYSHLHTDGINEALPTGPGFYDRDRFIQNGLNASLSYSPDAKLMVSPFFRYQYLDAEYDDGAFADAFNTSYSNFLSAGLTSSYKHNKTRFVLNYAYSYTDRIYNSSFPDTLEGNTHLADFFVNHKFSDKVQFVAGLEERHSLVRQKRAEIEKPDANLFSTYASLAFNNLAGYFDIEFGGRFNSHNQYGDNFTYSITPSVKFFDNGFRLFGTVGTAFKAPTLTELYGPYGANPDLKPQKADNYEAGFVLSPDKHFTLRVVGYERYLTDAIIYDATGYVNQDIQDDWGAEIEPSYSSKYFDIKGFYAFVKGKTLSEDESGSFVKTDVLLRRPKHAFGLNLGFKPGSKLYSSVNFRNYGQRHDAYFDPQTFSSVNVINKAYQLLDLYAEYNRSPRLKFFLNVNNVLDEDYQEISGYATMGANFMAGMSYKIK